MTEPAEQSAPGSTKTDPDWSIQRFTHDAMNSPFELLFITDDYDYARQFADEAFDEVDLLEQQLSRFIDHSDVGRINSAAPGQWVPVGPDTLACLAVAEQAHSMTRGAFDITFASDQPGMGWLEVSRDYHAVAKRIDGLRIDLGGVGKGFAVDRIAERLAEWQVGPALISAGQSTVRAVGSPPNTEHWTLDLRDPRTGGDRLGSITLRDAAISGSGIALHGRHIIDPRTRQPAAPRQAAWACCPSAALSDCLSTAFMVLGREEIDAVTRLHPQVGGLVMWTDQMDNDRTSHGQWPTNH